MLRSISFDYNDAYVVVSGTATVTEWQQVEGITTYK